MASRDLGASYRRVRSACGSARPPPCDHCIVDVEETCPPYVALAARLRTELDLLKLSLRDLRRLAHADARDADDACDEKRSLCEQAAGTLRVCERQLKAIAAVAPHSAPSQQERTIRANILRGLGAELAALARTFHDMQQAQQHQQQQRQKAPHATAVEAAHAQQQQIVAVDEGKELEAEEALRAHKIEQLARSVNEVGELFERLHAVVLDGGTLLDRIDYNVERSLENVRGGGRDLGAADGYSAKAPVTKCLLALLAVVVSLFVILVLKKSVQ